MKHPEADRLSAFADGDLPARDRDAVRAHVDGCPDCARAVEELAGLARAARRLDRPEPPPTLWSAIEGALDRPERRFWSWRSTLFGALAGGAAVALVAWLVAGAGTGAGTRAGVGGGVGGGGARAALAGGAVARTAADDLLLAEAEAELDRAAASYEQAVSRLRAILMREQRRWDPEARARVTERLLRLDQAVIEERAALRRNPADGAGAELLFAAYQRQIDFLAEAVHRGSPAAPEWR